jgi:hypothetical protein
VMASMVVSLLRDPAKAKSMGKRGRAVVAEKFSERALLEKTEALYQRLLARRVGTGDATDQVRPIRTASVNVNQPAGASPPSRP